MFLRVDACIKLYYFIVRVVDLHAFYTQHTRSHTPFSSTMNVHKITHTNIDSFKDCLSIRFFVHRFFCEKLDQPREELKLRVYQNIVR